MEKNPEWEDLPRYLLKESRHNIQLAQLGELWRQKEVDNIRRELTEFNSVRESREY